MHLTNVQRMQAVLTVPMNMGTYKIDTVLQTNASMLCFRTVDLTKLQRKSPPYNICNVDDRLLTWHIAGKPHWRD
jgi:hypothetical protein